MRHFVIFQEFNQLPLDQVSRIQRRVVMVLSSMIETNGYEKHRATEIIPELQTLLDDVKATGGFGALGENDPRGNFQEGTWSMNKVQGIGKLIEQRCVDTVLRRMVYGAMQSSDYAVHLGMHLTAPLDRLLGKGFWGGEGHLDPRGDRRDHNHWSMSCVQGVDTVKDIVQVTTESILGDTLQVCKSKLQSGDRDGAFADMLDAMLEASTYTGMILQEHQAALRAMRGMLVR